MICELLERLIKDNMVDFLDRHNLLNSYQHVFPKSDVMLNKYVMFFLKITKRIDPRGIVSKYYLLRFSERF